MADSPMKIVVDVVNSDKVAKLTEEIKRQEQEILQWNAAMAKAGPHATGFAAQMQANMTNAGKAISNAKTEMASLQAASGSAGRGLQQLSYAVDDVQYGFNAIVNNIPQIVMGLGGSVGVAGAVGIAAVAINQMVKHWAEMTSLFEAGWSNKSYDQLVATKKAAEEAADAYDKLAKSKTEWEEKSAEKSDKIIKDIGANKLRTAIASTLSASAEGAEMTDQERKAIASVQNANPKVKKGVEDRIRKRLLEENAKEAERIEGSLSAGGEVGIKARSRLAHLMKLNPEAFPEEARTAYGGAQLDPKSIRKHEEAGTPGPYFTDDDDVGDKGAKRREEIRKGQQEIDKANDERAAKTRKEIEKTEETAKSKRTRGLEDERKAVQRAQQDFDDKMWHRQHEVSRGKVMAGGAENLIKMYQEGAGGADSPKELAKKAHEQRVKTNTLLRSIDDKLKLENRPIIKT